MSLQELLERAAESAQEIAYGALGASAVRWHAHPAERLPDHLSGVYIPLIGTGLALQLGLLGQQPVCASLAKSLLGLGPDESMDSEGDVFDALGEVANLIAGGLKARIAGDCRLSLGIPLALRGTVFPSAAHQLVHGALQVDALDVWLVLAGTQQERP